MLFGTLSKLVDTDPFHRVEFVTPTQTDAHWVCLFGRKLLEKSNTTLMTFALFVCFDKHERDSLTITKAGSGANGRRLWNVALWLTRIVRQVALFCVSLFSIQLVLCCLKSPDFSFVISCGSGHPKTVCRLEYTIMHNDDRAQSHLHSIHFYARAKLFCVIFLCLILSQKKCRK